MQIKLVPASSLPTVLFTVTYSEPPDYLGFPASWAQALHRLSADDLELPGTVHAFDKTTWIVAILHSVTFDLARRSVACTYVDGHTHVWPLDGENGEEKGMCLAELESVLRDVNQSAVEAEREKRRIEAQQQAARMPPPASPVPSQTMSEPILPTQQNAAAGTVPHSKHGKDKDGKHKKQRSLLMSLVASLVAPRHTHQSGAHHGAAAGGLRATASPPSSPSPSHASVASDAEEEPSERMSSTALRRRARSTLVNAFRRHVLMRLSAAAQPGGYTAWIARSMLARVEHEMSQMVRDAGGPPDMDPSMAFCYGKPARPIAGARKTPSDSGATFATESAAGAPSAPLVDEPPPFFEDEDTDPDADDADPDGDRDSASTDTDGSSVHTPDTVSFDGSPFFAPPRCSSPPPSPPAPSSPPALSPGSSPSPTRPKLQPSPPLSPSKQRQLRRQTMFAPRSQTPVPPSPPSPRMIQGRPNFTPCDLAAYTALSGQRLRLQTVLTRIDAQLTMQAQDERQLQSVLEIKSRRRAWSNRQFKGTALVKDMGLCTPARCSPLGRFEPINASDLVELQPSQPASERAGKVKRGLVVSTAEHNIMRLFPVCEEEEEEDEPAPPYERSPDIPGQPPDLNEKDDPGMTMPTVRLVEERPIHDVDGDVILPLPLPLQRHAVPVRPRTRSILTNPDPTMNADATYPGGPTANEKLGLGVLEPQTKVELFDVYHSEDEDEDDPGLGDVSIGLNGCGGKHSEFVIGMDIPETFSMAPGRRYDQEEWISANDTALSSR